MKEKLTNNIVLKIASVLFAIAVWLIVLNINDPDKTVSVSGIPVEIINDEAITSLNKAYTVKSGLTCSISISGPRSIVDMLDTEDFTAVADIKDLSLTNSVPIEVELKKNTYKSKVDIKVKTMLKLDIEDIIEREYDIKVQYSGKAASSYVVANTNLEVGKVVITAPRSKIEKINSVVTTIDISNRNNDFESNTALKLLDINHKEISFSDKDIKLSFGSVKATSTVLYVKTLPIVCELPDAIDYDTLISGYEISEDSIEVAGRKELLDGIESIMLPVNLDEYTDVEDGFTLTYKVDELLPEGVYKHTSTEEILLDIFINHQADKTITTKVKNISISNIPDGMVASLVTKGDISYTIRGLKVYVEDIDEEDIILKVDVGELTEGTHSLEVQVTLPDGIELVDSIFVEVSLAKRQEESSQTPSEDVTTETDTSLEQPSETETTEEETSEEETTTSIEGEEST